MLRKYCPHTGNRCIGSHCAQFFTQGTGGECSTLRTTKQLEKLIKLLIKSNKDDVTKSE